MGYVGLTSYGRPGSAFSSIAVSSMQNAIAIVNGLQYSESLFGAKAALLDSLAALEEECSEDGWDGYGALPVDPEALNRARDLVQSLPDGFPLPEISPEPDGSISLDWIASKRRMLSVSVGKSDRLPYAWINGTDSGHGVVRSKDYTLPPKIMNEIQDVMGHAAPFLRLAV